MLIKNSDAILGLLQPSDVVLDIGGWAHCFNRANYVMDQEPYATRGFYNRTFAKNNPFPPIGGEIEHFTASTWIQRDICDKAPFPFKDKEIDYVVCSHTLEDIRDPLWVCSEMIRIAKRGYIEIPSRAWESSRGIEPLIAGLSHHRWLIDVDQQAQEIRFMMKFHSIHRWEFSLPAAFLRSMPEEDKVQWLFWEDKFASSEVTLHGDASHAELERFVRSVRPYSQTRLRTARWITNGVHFTKRAARYANRSMVAILRSRKFHFQP
jgi:hypothetical protein